MSLVTASEKRDRVYERAFDHDEARALRAEGWTWEALADKFGVSPAAVRRVCDAAARKRIDAQALEWARENRREPCRGGCGRLVWMVSKGRTGYCRDCLTERRAARHVRDGELRCIKCGEWKSDGEFSNAPRRKTRRGKGSWCRSCATAARRDHRRRNPEQERATARNYRRRRKPVSKFVVLQRREDGCWQERGEVDAASRLHAVERVADSAGTYAAVSRGQLQTMEVEPAMAFKVTDRKERSQPRGQAAA